ncbi:MAG: Stealth CR1 domain-containing protein [Lactobacillaceae bacterium]|jgi:hypothetical protein|nr:Stealth CR1 domain-containing protein [Lactobacillaceae bacterium]
MANTPIDIVIPWVDGNDPQWLEKKRQYSPEAVDNAAIQLNSNNRYDDYGTLKFLLRSIEKNMPWVNNVFLVTDQQQPDWLNDTYEHLKLVDHTDFIDGALPTFNSSVITTSTYKIPGLADNFISFNDDMLAWGEIAETDFFVDNIPVDTLGEKPIMPQSYRDVSNRISVNHVALLNEKFNKRQVMKQNITHFFNFKYGLKTNLQTFFALPYSLFFGLYVTHMPQAFRKADFVETVEMYPEAFNNTWSHRFREGVDVNEWLVANVRNLKGQFVPGRLRGEYLVITNFHEAAPAVKADTQAIVIQDSGFRSESAFANLDKMLTARFPEKSRFEK